LRLIMRSIVRLETCSNSAVSCVVRNRSGSVLSSITWVPNEQGQCQDFVSKASRFMRNAVVHTFLLCKENATICSSAKPPALPLLIGPIGLYRRAAISKWMKGFYQIRKLTHPKRTRAARFGHGYVDCSHRKVPERFDRFFEELIKYKRESRRERLINLAKYQHTTQY
jgi:hypothetical protein